MDDGLVYCSQVKVHPDTNLVVRTIAITPISYPTVLN